MKRAVLLGTMAALVVAGGLHAAGGLSGLYQLTFKQGGTSAVSRTARSKISDYVSVKDFGATGDGTTNDTAGVTAAIAYAGDFVNVYFPCPGTYQTTTWGTIPCGYESLVAATGAVPRPLGTKIQEFLSAKDFGAVGNGITDDTTAIGNLINAAASTQIVNLPCPGTYISSTYGTLACGVYYPPLAATGATLRAIPDKLFDTVSVKDFGAVGDGVANDTAAIQAALNTGSDVVCGSGRTYLITNSLYMNTTGQSFSGNCLISMDASLGKPALWLGASDANGTDDLVGALNMKINGIRLRGTGTKAAGSAGIAFKRVTTTTLDGVRSWSFYAGLEIRGYAIANTVINPDLRLNTVGIYDPTHGAGACGVTCKTWEGSRVISGRIEQNDNEGAIIGSKGIGFIGTVIEGNSPSGALPQVRILQGFDTGPVSFVNVYIEESATNTSTSVIAVDANNCGLVELLETQVNGHVNNAANLYIIETASTCTEQAFSIIGGRFVNFKNYISGAISNNSVATVMPTWADASRDTTTSLTATAGAHIWQIDRTLGFKTDALINSGSSITGSSLTSTAVAAATALQLTTNAFINFGGTATLKGDGSQLIANGNIFAGGSGNGVFHGATLQRDDTVNSLTVKGNVTDGSGNIGVKLTNATTLTNAGAKIACFYPDNNATVVACVDLKGGYVTSTGKISSGRVTPTYGASVAIDAQLGNTFAVTATNATAFTIANPTNASTGQRICVMVRNTSGGALGAITWDTLYKLATFASPATGFSRSIDFVYDGTNWVEVGRSQNDIAN